MTKAIWNGSVLAESDDIVVVEGSHYFPAGSLNRSFFESSEHASVCGWKGTANYYHVVAASERNDNAAWFYQDPKEAAENIRGRVAFWKGVEVG